MKKEVMMVFLILFLTGCTSVSNNLPQSNLFVNVNLEKSQYDIVGNISGEATVVRVLIFPIGVERKCGYLYGNNDQDPWIIGALPSAAKRMAVYKAIENSPNVDYMIMPKYDIVDENYFFYRSLSVKVTGLGIKIK